VEEEEEEEGNRETMELGERGESDPSLEWTSGRRKKKTAGEKIRKHSTRD
jgi:hypothetical protein